MPSACIMRCSAAVHELTATQSSAPCMVANASSKDRTRSPMVSQPLSMMVDKANLSGSPTMAELTKSMVDSMCDELSSRRPQYRDHLCRRGVYSCQGLFIPRDLLSTLEIVHPTDIKPKAVMFVHMH